MVIAGANVVDSIITFSLLLHIKHSIASLEKEINSQGGTAVAYTLDVTSVEQVHQAATEVQQELCDVTILINNAMFVTYNDILRIDVEHVKKILDVNVVSHFVVCIFG